MLDKGEVVCVITSVGSPARPADVREVDNVNCLDDYNMQIATFTEWINEWAR